MALQSSASFASTSTVAGTATATSGSFRAAVSSGSLNGSQLFNPDGYPPIILAFVAMGLFAAGMLFLLIWKKVHNRPSRTPPSAAAKSSSLGKKPSLHEIWTCRPVHSVDPKWEGYLPLCAQALWDQSATTKPSISTHRDSISSPTSRTPSNHDRTPTSHYILSNLLYPFIRQRSIVPQNKPSVAARQVEERTAPMIQVMIPIAMPMPMLERTDYEKFADYAVGVCQTDCDWRDGG